MIEAVLAGAIENSDHYFLKDSSHLHLHGNECV